ncbi:MULTISPECIES: YgjP-like metallopeptidase domain-containing protein [Streptomyces]|uniref:YgjP-like metallopeptidase domain-containing protein n=1 Tax=Streptomyces sp. 900129855 TaxID=3155129 RepID=A0ABV2ZRR1_9ACTN
MLDMTAAITEALLKAALQTDGRFTKYVHQIKISTRRKTLGMSIEAGEPGITLHVPVGTPADTVISTLVENSDRLAGLIRKAREHIPDHPAKELVNGTGFLWLGRSDRLKIVDNARMTLERAHTGQWWFLLSRDAVQLGARPFIDWYAREGTAWLNREAPQLWSRMAGNRPIPTVHAADIGGRRWGTYDSGKHEVRIAWQTLQLRPALVRHVLAHELTHALVRTGKPHGPEFWRAFERGHIGARQEARQLDEEGRRVWMGDIAS